MSDRENPMVFTARPQEIDIEKWLDEGQEVKEIEFLPGRVCEHQGNLEFRPGRIYIYWGEIDDD